MKRSIISLIVFLCASSAYAGCWMDGIEYKVGTVKGPVVCAPDGYWKPNN